MARYAAVMAIEQDLKIFISWSGTLAKEVTKVLRAWLPKMFDHIDPWASDVDIDAGLRGLDVIQDRLNASSFGIIVVTTENMNKSWLNFEAGALSKRLEGDATRVVPLLVNFENINQLHGPLNQFQAIMLDRGGMKRLCGSIAGAIGLDKLTIDSRFEWAWEDLDKQIHQSKADAGEQPLPTEPNEKELLAQVLSSLRSMERAQSRQRSETEVVNQQRFRAQDEADAVVSIASKYRPVEDIDVDKSGQRPQYIVKLSGDRLDKDEFNRLTEEFKRFDAEVVIAPRSAVKYG